jgi:hypothetical protein
LSDGSSPRSTLLQTAALLLNITCYMASSADTNRTGEITAGKVSALSTVVAQMSVVFKAGASNATDWGLAARVADLLLAASDAIASVVITVVRTSDLAFPWSPAR